MEVKLVSYSMPAVPFKDELRGPADLVAFCARVSNPSNQMNSETSDKLIQYLIEHRHWSPFEMTSVCLEVTSTRDICRQMLRHRSLSFQEFSQRYADPTEEMHFVTREARLQDTKNRQNSIMTDDEKLHKEWTKKQKDVIRRATETYQWAVENGIAREQARAVLPEGLMESKMYVNGTVRSWIHYVQVRTSNGTQREHVELARACATQVAKVFPLILGQAEMNTVHT